MVKGVENTEKPKRKRIRITQNSYAVIILVSDLLVTFISFFKIAIIS